MWGKFLIFFAILAGLIGIPLMAIFILPNNNGRLMGLPIFLSLIILASYIFFVGFLFFYLSPKIFSFPPEKNIASDITILKKDLTDYFTDNEEKRKVFEVTPIGNELYITWSKDLKYNQIVNIGSKSIKSVFILKFEQGNSSIKVVNRQVDIDWSASTKSFNWSFNFQQGIYLDYETTYKPSIEIIDGKPQMSIKNLKYNSMELISPIQKIASQSGWTLHFGIVLNTWVQNILLAISILMLILGLGGYFLL
jgi:hypothetical protein